MSGTTPIDGQSGVFWDSLASANFIEAAATGGFTLTSDHAESLANELQAGLDTVNKVLENTAMLEQPPPMTASPAGLFVSKVMYDTANDGQGMRTQLMKAKEELPKYIEALRVAAKRYRETEHATTAEINSLHPGP
ncbi:hypothetical protein [Amycolatopsis sp. NPDC059657]|uniref:hypothetical protein n=1 Tax=Amycolatopsis sp. NPDC059657 TaxID=3346899 RepID=UPI00366CE6DF